MKILIFGAAGQVGHEVCRAPWPAGASIVPLGREQADVTDAGAVGAALIRERPDLVVNLAAYTAVDSAESTPDLAWKTNCAGAALVAAACHEAAVPLIHMSTDYVFDGAKPAPYREDDPVGPLGVYGRSKEAGERAVRAALAQHVILRAQWIYGVHGGNFVKTMLRLGRERDALRVVADQHGAPTAAKELAAALAVIAGRIARGKGVWGTFHLAATGSTSWHGFAEAIFDLAAPGLGRRPRIEPIATAQYPTPARRPLNSVFDCRKIAEAYGITPVEWRAPLAAVVAELLAGAEGGGA